MAGGVNGNPPSECMLLRDPSELGGAIKLLSR